MWLTNRFKVVTHLTHGYHFLENAVFLPPHAGGRFRVHNPQRFELSHQYATSTLSRVVQVARLSSSSSGRRTRQCSPSLTVQLAESVA